jgi:FdhD protein
MRRAEPDLLALEEPLEIRLSIDSGGERIVRPLYVTMRTPGADHELAAGFLLTEGIIRSAADIEAIEGAGPALSPLGPNTAVVRLRDDVTVNLRRLQRNFYTTSSCGVCGKTSIEAIRVRGTSVSAKSLTVRSDLLHRLPRLAREAQSAFEVTGGLHAAALFTPDGELIAIREDVGRHNALDKLIGSQVLLRRDVTSTVLLVSGRASFELVQKAAVAGIPILAAVGAPSSLAAELATECDMTLVGFLRDHRFNVYSGAERIAERP